MLQDKDGNRLFRKVTVKVIFPNKIFPPKTFTSRAEQHKGISSDGVQDVLMQVADKLEQLYPYWEFRAIELTPVGRTARYVFDFAKYRAHLPSQVEKMYFSNINPPSGTDDQGLGNE